MCPSMLFCNNYPHRCRFFNKHKNSIKGDIIMIKHDINICLIRHENNFLKKNTCNRLCQWFVMFHLSPTIKQDSQCYIVVEHIILWMEEWRIEIQLRKKWGKQIWKKRNERTIRVCKRKHTYLYGAARMRCS